MGETAPSAHGHPVDRRAGTATPHPVPPLLPSLPAARRLPLTHFPHPARKNVRTTYAQHLGSPRPQGSRAFLWSTPIRNAAWDSICPPALRGRYVEWPAPVSSACNGATRPKGKSSISSPPSTTSSSAT